MDNITVWSKQHVLKTLPLRDPGSHKGTFGTALLIAGSPGMPGAAVLSATAAMRSGLGKLVVATDKESVLPIAVHVPEATYDLNLFNQMEQPDFSFEDYRAIAIGPGMPPDDKTEMAVRRLLAAGKPLVLDAGALSKRHYDDAAAPVILTPHPAEFSRITGVTVEELQHKRNYHASSWAVKLGVAIVLKGPRTVIAFPDGKTFSNPTGNSALAKGGTGDTLTGMLLGFLCFHENWQHAVLNAVHLHGACSDEWIKTRSPHTLLVHELSTMLPKVMKSFEQ